MAITAAPMADASSMGHSVNGTPTASAMIPRHNGERCPPPTAVKVVRGTPVVLCRPAKFRAISMLMPSRTERYNSARP